MTSSLSPIQLGGQEDVDNDHRAGVPFFIVFLCLPQRSANGSYEPLARKHHLLRPATCLKIYKWASHALEQHELEVKCMELPWEGKAHRAGRGERPSAELVARTGLAALALSRVSDGCSVLSQKLAAKGQRCGALCLAWPYAACRRPVPVTLEGAEARPRGTVQVS